MFILQCVATADEQWTIGYNAAPPEGLLAARTFHLTPFPSRRPQHDCASFERRQVAARNSIATAWQHFKLALLSDTFHRSSVAFEQNRTFIIYYMTYCTYIRVRLHMYELHIMLCPESYICKWIRGRTFRTSAHRWRRRPTTNSMISSTCSSIRMSACLYAIMEYRWCVCVCALSACDRRRPSTRIGRESSLSIQRWWRRHRHWDVRFCLADRTTIYFRTIWYWTNTVIRTNMLPTEKFRHRF